MKKIITYASLIAAVMCSTPAVAAVTRDLATDLATTGHVLGRKDNVTINVGTEASLGDGVVTVAFAIPPAAESYGAMVRLTFIGRYNDGDHPGNYIGFDGIYSLSTDYFGGKCLEERAVRSMSEGESGTVTTALSRLDGVLSGLNSTVFLRLREGGFNATSATGSITYEVIAQPGQVTNVS